MTLKIFDTMGREVKILFDGECQASETHEVEFRAVGLQSGLYFATLLTPNGEERFIRLMLVK